MSAPDRVRVTLELSQNLVYYLVMIKLNIHEAKTHLSKYLINLEKGESILLCKRNQPIAEIRPLPPVLQGQRPFGLAKGTITMPDSFWDPLPDDELNLFEGKNV